VAEDRDKLLARIDELMGRLEQLEKQRRQDTQNELLLFVGTGLFVLVGFHMAGRR
jgi:prefoldin subunit 5